jgi:hypothetical protein
MIVRLFTQAGPVYRCRLRVRNHVVECRVARLQLVPYTALRSYLWAEGDTRDCQSAHFLVNGIERPSAPLASRFSHDPRASAERAGTVT